MRKRYLHDAFRAVDLNPHRFYSVEDIAKELETTGVLPSDLSRARLVSNLRSYALRHISAVYRRRRHGVYHYLGAAWTYPVPRLKPDTLGELEEEARQAVRLQVAREEPLPTQNEKPVVVQVQPRQRPPQLRAWLGRLALLAATVSAAFLVAGWGTTYVLDYTRRGPGAVLKNQPRQSTPSLQEKYSLAEAHYGMGNFEAAQKAIQDLLLSRNLEPALESDAFLLLAQIQRNRGFMNNALNYAMAAKCACPQEGTQWSARTRSVDTFLAVSFLRLKRYDEATHLLTELFEREPYSSYRGYIALMLADTYFWLEQPDIALTWNEHAQAEYRTAGDRTGIANATMNKAWLTVILGQFDAALSLLDEAERMCNQLDYQLMQPYLSVTRQLLAKCRTGKIDLRAIPQSPDRELKLYIDFLMDYECGSSRIVVNDPPPPPPPDSDVRPPPPRASGATKTGLLHK